MLRHVAETLRWQSSCKQDLTVDNKAIFESAFFRDRMFDYEYFFYVVYLFIHLDYLISIVLTDMSYMFSKINSAAQNIIRDFKY